MGFFAQTELNKLAKKDTDTNTLIALCSECGLYKNSRTKKLGITGSGEKRILVIGDFPSDLDDFNMTQFYGDDGDYLKNIFRSNGLVLNRDCWKINAIRCSVPPEVNQDNFGKYVDLCKPSIEKFILDLKPEYVLLLGTYAVSAVFGNSFSNCNINRWRGNFIKDEKFKTTLFATFHPREYTIDNYDRGMDALIRRDLITFCKTVISQSHKYTAKPDYEKCVKICSNIKQVESIFNDILLNELPVYYDYESTGLKPHKRGHKIVLLSLALSETEAYAIPVRYKTFWTEKELQYIETTWNKILAHKRIRKSAHNIKFEDMWSSVCFGTRNNNVEWCSLMGAHIMDNRRAWNALKFQAFVQFGVRPYDEHIKHFLEGDADGFNNVEKIPFKDLCVYGGLDCVFGIMLKNMQQKFFAEPQNKKLFSAFKFFKDGLNVMSEIQLNGIAADYDYYIREQTVLAKNIEELEHKLLTSREARAFKEVYKRDIILTSDQDIGKLYFEVLKHTGTRTLKGNWKTDKTTLGRIKIQFSTDLIELKKLNKMYDTYFKQYIQNIVNGRLHPFFDLHIPISYRSSSSEPNLQNTPKRDDTAKKLIRRGLKPDTKRVLIEADFAGAEVVTSCAYHRDPNFRKYLLNPSTDMHRDAACDVFKLNADDLNHPDFDKAMKKLAKKIRNEVKNKWVFAQFYGDWFDSCGRALYETCYKEDKTLPSGILLSEHMDNIGIGDIEDFLLHCKECERILWYERFPQYTQWKKDIYDFYVKNGYIESYLGFRFQGYMDRKQASNLIIQGTSFHLLVYTLIQVSRMIKKLKLKTKLVIQVHDSLVASTPLDEISTFIAVVHNIVSQLHKVFPWMNVPMKIEAEMTKPLEDGGTFNEMFTIPEIMMGSEINLKKVYEVQ